MNLISTKPVDIRDDCTNGTTFRWYISLQPWLLPLAVMLVTAAIVGIHYETDDDATFANILSGAYGPDRIHLIYINILIGCLLRPLYLLNNGCNWYVLFLLLLLFLSAAALCFLAQRAFGAGPGAALTLAGMLLFTADALFRFQYTKVAGVCVAAGLVWIAVNLGQGLRRMGPGIALAFAGSLLRFDMFLCIGGLSAAILLDRFFALDKAGRRQAVKAMCLLFALVMGAKGIDTLAYQLDPAWRVYRQYNDARTLLVDVKLSYESPGRYIVGNGLTSTGFGILCSWNFDDREVFSTQHMAELAAQIPDPPLPQTLQKALRQFPSLFRAKARGEGILGGDFLALCVLGCLVLVRWNKRRALSAAGTLVLLWAEYAYLTYISRPLPRVLEPMELAAGLFLLLCTDRDGFRHLPGAARRAGSVAAVALAAVLIWPGIRFCLDNRASLTPTPEQRVSFDVLSEDKEHFYLLRGGTSDDIGLMDVWHPKAENYFSNIFFCGGFQTRSPAAEQTLAAYGISRPLVDAVDNDKVFLDGYDIELMAAYASEQLGRPVHAVSTGPYFLAAWQLVSEE